MAVDYSKPLRAKFVVEGVVDSFEEMLAGNILLNVYNAACDVTNNGGIEKFNSEWNESHPGFDYKDEDSHEEYMKAYERYFKSIADSISESCRTGGLTYKLRENEPVLINFDDGYFTLYGYKEQSTKIES